MSELELFDIVYTKKHAELIKIQVCRTKKLCFISTSLNFF